MELTSSLSTKMSHDFVHSATLGLATGAATLPLPDDFSDLHKIGLGVMTALITAGVHHMLLQLLAKFKKKDKGHET